MPYIANTEQPPYETLTAIQSHADHNPALARTLFDAENRARRLERLYLQQPTYDEYPLFAPGLRVACFIELAESRGIDPTPYLTKK